MTKVIFDLCDRRERLPRGTPGRRPTPARVGGEDERNRNFLEEAVAALGAVVAGRRTYDASVAWWS
jgi:hypothetical protein